MGAGLARHWPEASADAAGEEQRSRDLKAAGPRAVAALLRSHVTLRRLLQSLSLGLPTYRMGIPTLKKVRQARHLAQDLTRIKQAIKVGDSYYYFCCRCHY